MVQQERTMTFRSREPVILDIFSTVSACSPRNIYAISKDIDIYNISE